MIRLVTAAAMVALFATPVLAQSGPSPGGGLDQTPMQSSPEAGGSIYQPAPGAQTQVPSDCTPNDPRPECQTAQLPSDQSSGSRGLGTEPSGSLGEPGTSPESPTPDDQRSIEPSSPGSPPTR